MHSTPAAAYPLTEYFQAIARSGRFWHDRPFPWTSPSCTFTETKSLQWPGDAGTAPFSSHSVWCSAKQLSVNSLLSAERGCHTCKKPRVFPRQACYFCLDKRSRRGLMWKPQVLGLMHKNKATVEKSLHKYINLNSVYFWLTIKTFIKSNNPVFWVILQTRLLWKKKKPTQTQKLKKPASYVPPLVNLINNHSGSFLKTVVRLFVTKRTKFMIFKQHSSFCRYLFNPIVCAVYY